MLVYGLCKGVGVTDVNNDVDCCWLCNWSKWHLIKLLAANGLLLGQTFGRSVVRSNV